MSWLDKIFGDPNKKALRKLYPILDRVNSFAESTKKLSDKELKAKTAEFKEKIAKGTSLDEILPEAFAVVREAVQRVDNKWLFDVQILGGIALHQGKISEMKTGEGKTHTSLLPMYLNALTGKGVHLVTVNDYLAKRDCNWMGSILHFLGISTACIVHSASYMYQPKVKDSSEVSVEMENLLMVGRHDAYMADITYGTNNEFGFDYLRDNMATRPEDVVQRDLYYSIVDEVDSILIDEARTPLIISAPDEDSTNLYKKFAMVVPSLTPNVDYTIDEKMRSAILTDEGITKIEQLLGVKGFYEGGDVTMAHHVEQSLRAYALYKKDKDYVVKDGEVLIVDEFTGRLMPGRRYSEGLHQAIEAKENVEVKEESKTMATITFQNYFRLYEKLAGMTGTAKTEEEEFYKIYGLEVVTIPTNRPMIRQDGNDLIYINEGAKFRAVVERIKQVNATGQPLLVGTIAIEKSELLSDMLKQAGVTHNVLNAKNHEREAEIIKDAGQKGAVTIATNMAGRGTDIKLGEGVADLGGLFVLGTERHESRRIDNQLRGRSGRQGDPGKSLFYVSLEDDLMRLFASERIKGLMETMRIPEDQPLEHKMISNGIEQAQKKVEGHNFDIRKHVVQYDDVMNRQRDVIYKKRRAILKNESVKDDMWQDIKTQFESLVNFHTPSDDVKIWNVSEIVDGINPIFELSQEEQEAIKSAKDRDKILDVVMKRAEKNYAKKESEYGEATWRQVEKAVYLRVIDVLWVEHLDAMVRMREGINLQGYAQKDPLAEYKQEAYGMFQRLLSAIAEDATRMIYKVKIDQPKVVQKTALEADSADLGKKQLAYQGAEEPTGDFKEEKEELSEEGQGEESQEVKSPIQEPKKAHIKEAPVTPVSDSPLGSSAVRNPLDKRQKVGRNDPCPCGSGKKYKKCCGNKV